MATFLACIVNTPTLGALSEALPCSSEPHPRGQALPFSPVTPRLQSGDVTTPIPPAAHIHSVLCTLRASSAPCMFLCYLMPGSSLGPQKLYHNNEPLGIMSFTFSS